MNTKTDLEQNLENSKEKQPKNNENSAEYLLLTFIIIITGILFIESLKVDGIFQGVPSGPGSLPQLFTLVVLFIALIECVKLYKGKYKQKRMHMIIEELLPKPVILLIIFIAIYTFLINLIGFALSSLLFLWASMFSINPTKPIKKLIISSIIVIVLLIIFKNIFNVLLP